MKAGRKKAKISTVWNRIGGFSENNALFSAKGAGLYSQEGT